MTTLPRIKQEIFHCLQRGPRTRSQIIDYVWQFRPQDARPRAIKVHISQMRKLLKGKYEIRCSRGKAGILVEHPYTLVKL